jgi:endonuclease/exonuclease/phosphatase family metal-dependent hydrolase
MVRAEPMPGENNRDAAKIDHVLVSPGTRVLSAAVMPNREPMVSDHHPVSARLVFP